MLVIFFGRRGSGKTHAVKNTIPQCEAPVAVIDVLGNFKEQEAYHTTSLAKAVEHLEKYKSFERDEARLEFTDEVEPVLVLTPRDPDEAIEYISSSMWHLHGGTIVIDEGDMLTPYKGSAFDYIIRYGRNHRVHLLIACRRPAEISKNLTAGCNRMFVFQTTEPRDIKYYSETTLGERAFMLSRLPQYHGLYVDNDKRTTGIFKTDDKGQVILLSEESLNDSIDLEENLIPGQSSTGTN